MSLITDETKNRARELIEEAIRLLVDQNSEHELEVIELNYNGSIYTFEGEIIADQRNKVISVQCNIRRKIRYSTQPLDLENGN